MERMKIDCANNIHFWSANKGIQECLFCPAIRTAPDDKSRPYDFGLVAKNLKVKR